MIVIFLCEGYRYFQSPALPCMHGDMGAGELASARDGWGRFGWTLVAAPNFDQTGLSDGSSGWVKGPAKYQWQTVGRGEWRSGAGGNFAPDTAALKNKDVRMQTREHRGERRLLGWGRAWWFGAAGHLAAPDRGASWSVLAAHSRSGIARIRGGKEAAEQATTCRELDAGAAFLVGRGGRWDMAM